MSNLSSAWAVIFRREFQADCEVINDINGDVINLFRILQRHYPRFMDMLKFQIASRKELEHLQRVEPDTLTDLERAARFLYLQRFAIGGKVSGQNIGTSPGTPGQFNVTKLGQMPADIHERLAGVLIRESRNQHLDHSYIYEMFIL